MAFTLVTIARIVQIVVSGSLTNGLLIPRGRSYLTIQRYSLLSFCLPIPTRNTQLIDGIAATTSGFDCIPRLVKETSGTAFIHNCTIIKNGVAEPCRFGRYYMPGSNLYFACWACMLSLVAIALRWKAAKALKFAQSKAEQEQQQQALDQAGGEAYSDVDDDDDDDDDDDETR